MPDDILDDDDDAGPQPDYLSEIRALRKLRHAKSQARCETRRRKKKAPRRDDFARAALFMVLIQYRTSRTEQDRATVRGALLTLLADAGFNRNEAAATLVGMAEHAPDDVSSYLRGRGADQETRGKWVSFATPQNQQLKGSNGGSAQGRGQQLIENGVTSALGDGLEDPF